MSWNSSNRSSANSSDRCSDRDSERVSNSSVNSSATTYYLLPTTSYELRSLSFASRVETSHHVVTYVTRERGDGMMSLRQIEVAA